MNTTAQLFLAVRWGFGDSLLASCWCFAPGLLDFLKMLGLLAVIANIIFLELFKL
ncbi:hypothetical protein SYNPCC7002_D0011 (plasmid) [Picosynechococcus sp. PCC 7002]|nr:hypothetical protein SYNPCC7002_D0011 [Picosynechococcus sp. PCC 7002]